MIGNFFDEKTQTLTIILMSFPCKWNKCSHCYFHEESSTDKNSIIFKNSEILDEASEILERYNPMNIKIFNGGSFFELPTELYHIIERIVDKKTLSIETRPEMITIPEIEKLEKQLNPKIFNIFIGFDSFNDGIRNNILKKGIPQSEIYRISSLKIPNVYFYSYVIFGIEGIKESSIIESVRQFNSFFSGVTAIEFRKHKGLKLKQKLTSNKLKDWLKLNCLSVDFISEKDDQWEII
ncbi:MAG: hypothetical protein EAX96_09100 [Candidatus Lokiarchaeota archaeon]|nr:hypothetical protein [Candidatus Lokiarchaeota archaeon]